MVTKPYVGRSVYTITWGKAFARAIGAPWTPEVDRFFRAWAQSEASGAKHNPFATTQRMPGSTTHINTNGTPNSAGVQDYKTWQQGVDATSKTIRSGRYGSLLTALRAGKSALAMARGLRDSPWGTGGLAIRVLTDGGPRAFPIGQCYPPTPAPYTRKIRPGMVGEDVDELLRALGNVSTFYDDDLDEHAPVAKVKAHQRKRFPFLGIPDGILGPKSYRSITGHR
jgi:hypothetical protein